MSRGNNIISRENSLMGRENSLMGRENSISARESTINTVYENPLNLFMQNRITLERLMQHYDISNNGFVPESNEIDLPEIYQEWEDTCKILPQLIENGTLESVIEDLPLISTDVLITKQQKKRAYLILSMIGNGYLWKNGADNIPKKLPENIAYPWYRVAKSLGLKPILTHAAVDLYNCTWSSNMDKVDPDQMDCLYTITGTPDEKWFYLIMSSIELEGQIGIQISFNLLKAYHEKNDHNIVIELTKLAENIGNVEQLLKRTLEKKDNHEYKCDPKIFWNKLRIYLGGTADPKLFPEGLEFESIEGGFEKNKGGSAAQSSLIQLYDAVLGVTHVSVHTRKFLLLMRYYMPESHRSLLEDMESVCRLRDYVMMSSNPDLVPVFNECINKLISFREYHLYIVKRYIIDNLTDEQKADALGSGGTKIDGFLKISKVETKKSNINEKDEKDEKDKD